MRCCTIFIVHLFKFLYGTGRPALVKPLKPLDAAHEVLMLRMYNERIIQEGGYTNTYRVESMVQWQQLRIKYGGGDFNGALEDLMKRGLVYYHGKGKLQVVSLTKLGVDYARMLDKKGKYPDEKRFGGFRILSRG